MNASVATTHFESIIFRPSGMQEEINYIVYQGLNARSDEQAVQVENLHANWIAEEGIAPALLRRGPRTLADPGFSDVHWAIVALPMALSGCAETAGGPETFAVKGNVTINGTPASGVDVALMPVNGGADAMPAHSGDERTSHGNRSNRRFRGRQALARLWPQTSPGRQ